MSNQSFRLFYVGNKLEKHGKTPTSIDTLSKQLETFIEVIAVSDQLNLFCRMGDIIISLIKNRNKVDAVLIDTYSSLNFYIALVVALLSKMFKLDYYLYLHGGNLPARLQKNPKLSAYLFNNSSKNISPSAYLQEAFRNEGYETEFIPNNIDLSMYKPIHRKVAAPNILYVRAFSKVYNPQLAIRSFHEIFEKYPQAKMCMVGPDKDGTLQVCKDLCKQLKIDQAVEFTGKLTKNEWINRSKEFDIFINPTNFDNQPVSIIEAMALGLIIVSTNAGGLSFLIKDKVNGLLCNVNSIKEMADSIGEILSDNELAEHLSSNAIQEADKYSWSKVKMSWKRLFIDNEGLE